MLSPLRPSVQAPQTALTFSGKKASINAPQDVVAVKTKFADKERQIGPIYTAPHLYSTMADLFKSAKSSNGDYVSLLHKGGGEQSLKKTQAQMFDQQMQMKRLVAFLRTPDGASLVDNVAKGKSSGAKEVTVVSLKGSPAQGFSSVDIWASKPKGEGTPATGLEMKVTDLNGAERVAYRSDTLLKDSEKVQQALYDSTLEINPLGESQNELREDLSAVAKTFLKSTAKHLN